MTLTAMRASGRVAREVLDSVARALKVGMTTDEIDAIVHEETVRRGAYPSPLNYCGFPKSCCTSINEVICHGIPDTTVSFFPLLFFNIEDGFSYPSNIMHSYILTGHKRRRHHQCGCDGVLQGVPWWLLWDLLCGQCRWWRKASGQDYLWCMVGAYLFVFIHSWSGSDERSTIEQAKSHRVL